MNIFHKKKSEFSLFNDDKLISKAILASVGGFIAIAIASFFTNYTGYPLIMGSFGASCVLLFGYPDSPFSKPKNVIGGHLLSTFIGLTLLHLVGPQWWSMALALSLSVGLMIVTDMVHPPAGSNPIIVFLVGANWSFLFMPGFIGPVILVIIAFIFIKFTSKHKYPKSWI